ncbi:DUF7322 domain-containing protein [Natronorarus salvus]|uniref:DUF7322 domain-containing protein n=1 Tax=Natronorarus salvus TaxID=3117733 RepID=UPI002F2667BA
MVLDERSAHEPDEPQIGPRVPDVEPEDHGLTGPEGMSKSLLRAFWTLVLIAHIGVFGVSVGPMLVYFRGDWRLGGALALLGVFALAHGLLYYSRLDFDEMYGEQEGEPGEGEGEDEP